MHIESRWTLKYKLKVKLLTLMCVPLISQAWFLLSFRESSAGIWCRLVYHSRPHPSAAGRYNWHSSYQKALQGLPLNGLWALQALTPHPVSCQATSQYGFTPGNLEMWREKGISSSKFTVQCWNGFFFFLSYFLFLISHPAVKYHIMQSCLRN